VKKTFWFWPSSGDHIKCHDDELIRRVIFEYDSSYWSMKNGTGDSGIKIDELDNPTIFFYDEPYGFFIYFGLGFVPVKKGILLKDDIVIEHLIGSQPMRVPGICYRTREEAWEIISDLINEHKMNEKFNWVRLDDIEYDWELK
jgi:hypothetical protein